METTTIPGARITHVAVGEGYTLLVTFEDAAYTLDLAPLLSRGGAFAPLRESERFAEATIGGGGRWIEWPNGPDLCADALWLAAHGEHDLAAE